MKKPTVTLSDPALVWAAPVNDATQKWGVYSLSRMWRNDAPSVTSCGSGAVSRGLLHTEKKQSPMQESPLAPRILPHIL